MAKCVRLAWAQSNGRTEISSEVTRGYKLILLIDLTLTIALWVGGYVGILIGTGNPDLIKAGQDAVNAAIFLTGSFGGLLVGKPLQ